MRQLALSLTLLSLAAATAIGQNQNQFPPAKAPYEVIEATSKGDQFKAWSKQKLKGEDVFVSPAIDVESGYELNHFLIKSAFSGTGTMQATIAFNSKNDLATALSKRHLTRPLRKLTAGKAVRFACPYKGYRYAWVILKPTGDVNIEALALQCFKGKGTLYGHVGQTYVFDGGRLPYRLMYPRNYDPKKRYPLVVSVSGSGGVGADNRKNMEMVILGRYLFTTYWLDDDFACFSLVPQIPTSKIIPKGYWPKGPKGGRTEYHPDWSAVNENGWYTQASIALIKDLIKTPAISIDPDRIYFAGFSYGGKAIWEFFKADRQLFAAGIGVAGWPIGRAFSKPKGKGLEALKKEIQRYKHLPVMVMAGEKDGMRQGSQVVADMIKQAGGQAAYVEFPGAGHVASAGKAWANRKHMEWLFSQNRRKNPKPGPDPYPKGNYDTKE